MARRHMSFLDDELTVRYRKDVKHEAADTLSRIELARSDVRDINDNLPGTFCLL